MTASPTTPLQGDDVPVHPELPQTFNYALALDRIYDAVNAGSLSPDGKQIAQVVLQLGVLLLNKNKAYGDSALNPISVFTDPRTPNTARLAIRIDDKLSRLARGTAAGEDPVFDLMGYLVLYYIARAQEVALDVPF